MVPNAHEQNPSNHNQRQSPKITLTSIKIAIELPQTPLNEQALSTFTSNQQHTIIQSQTVLEIIRHR